MDFSDLLQAMEPYKIKVFYPVNVISKAERLNLLKEAHYNPFLVKAKDIFIDLLTDSGTGSQSSAQWSAMANAGHSTINSKYVKDFEKTIKHITNFKYVFPVHQGRGAEELVAKLLLKKDSIVLSNSLFDTTRAHVESTGAIGIDLVASNTKFKGDVDTGKFKEHLEKYGSRVHLVIVTCTNNVVAGAPVSMQNIEEITKLCRDRKIPVFIDACRFVENAYFIKIMDEKYSKCTILHIVHEMFSHFDGSTMSLKKDGISNEGGFVAFNDDKWGQEIFDIVEYKSGYSTYGGITGMNLAACTVGISEAMNENYLRSRIHQAKLLADFLEDNNIPIFKPVGAHAVYVKANEVLPHLEFLKYPAWSLACAVYIEGGIRTSEIGNVMFGENPDGTSHIHPFEYVRLALPRRTYTVNHLYFVAKTFGDVARKARLFHGMEIVKSSHVLRHFTIWMKPIKDFPTEDENENKKNHEIVKMTGSHGLSC